MSAIFHLRRETCQEPRANVAIGMTPTKNIMGVIHGCLLTPYEAAVDVDSLVVELSLQCFGRLVHGRREAAEKGALKALSAAWRKQKDISLYT